MSSALAVLTGDLIRSTELPTKAVDDAMAVLSRGADTIALWQNAPARFTRARGDGWQLCLMRPALCMRATIYLRARLLTAGTNFGSRISVGIGAGELPDNDSLNAASGSAFVLSGQGLDTMPIKSTFRFQRAAASTGAAQAAFILADALCANLTPAMARSLAPMLVPDPPSQTDVASHIGLSKQAVRDALARANAHSILSAVQAFETDLF